ncbi:hypothetical protein [Aromatoleum aromaticum]|uniref:hypothetical protein n=1 Tax=Aromatoleum aromaticum TaxID=551760 RepID=UPI0002F414FF|nr:hypothetical protein [Aromatoleum aromaticum]
MKTAIVTDLARYRMTRQRPITDLARYRMTRQRPITDLARYRMTRQRPITDACRWSEAIEEVTVANLRAAAVIQRMWLRLFIGG